MEPIKLKTVCTFSGTGGLSKGLEDSGFFETVALCEKNEFRQKILFKNNPSKYIFSLIEHLGYKDGWLTYRGKNYIQTRIDAICGGFPCQPFSIAGSKKAQEDDRDLWPEMFRFIAEVLPTWVIGENVDNFIDMAFTRTKIDLESKGYTVRPFVLPSCSLGAQHRRYRVFIVAHLDKEGWEARRFAGGNETENAIVKRLGLEKSIADTLQARWGSETTGLAEKNDQGEWESHWGAATADNFGYWWADQSGVGRSIHGLSPELDKAAEAIRRERVEAMGDSVVPLVAEMLGRAIGAYNHWLYTEDFNA